MTIKKSVFSPLRTTVLIGAIVLVHSQAAVAGLTSSKAANDTVEEVWKSGSHRTHVQWLTQGNHRTPREWLEQKNHRTPLEWLQGVPSRNSRNAKK